MANSNKRFFILGVMILGFALSPIRLIWAGDPESQVAPESAASPTSMELSLPYGPLDKIIERIPKLEMYPCDTCHSTPSDCNRQARVLKKEHTDKDIHFSKEGDKRWCHSCHKEGAHQILKLQGGQEITFNESYKLCGECHGTQYADWKKNIHGKRVGLWNGPREVYSCPECHDPHRPAFKPLEPKPSPVLPRGKSRSFWKLLLGDLIHEKH